MSKEHCMIVYHNVDNDTLLYGKESSYIFEPVNKSSGYVPRAFFGKSDILGKGIDRINSPFILTTNDEKLDLTRQMIKNYTNYIETLFINRKILQSERDSLLQEFLVTPARFVEPSQRFPGTFIYEAVTRKPNVDNKHGFVKGGVEKDETGKFETELECLRREIFEEIGDIPDELFPVDSSGNLLVSSLREDVDKFAVYYMQINTSQASILEGLIRDRLIENMGEMFSLGFYTIVDIINNTAYNNTFTKEVMKKLPYFQLKVAAQAAQVSPQALSPISSKTGSLLNLSQNSTTNNNQLEMPPMNSSFITSLNSSFNSKRTYSKTRKQKKSKKGRKTRGKKGKKHHKRTRG